MTTFWKAMRDPIWTPNDRFHLFLFYLKSPWYWLKEKYNLNKTGCLRKHNYDYIVSEYGGLQMFFEVCTRCKDTRGLTEPVYGKSWNDDE